MKRFVIATSALLACSSAASAHDEAAAPSVPTHLPAGAGAPASPATAEHFVKPATANPDVTSWTLDTDHSDVAFTVKHMMVSNVRGAFHMVDGKVDWHEKDIAKSSLDVTIQVASVDTHVQKRDDHLRSPDFFDANKFPRITFKSSKIRKKGHGLVVSGELTIRDVSKPVTLQVEGPTTAIKDPFGLVRTAVVAKTKIKRKDFGLVYNQTLETGGLLVGDEVNIEINAEFVKKM